MLRNTTQNTRKTNQHTLNKKREGKARSFKNARERETTEQARQSPC